jgi:hypothetical protein
VDEPYEDPLKARLLHARDQLNLKVAANAALEGDDLVDVRDDIVFIYQFYMNYLVRIERESKERDDELDKKKLNRNPTLNRILWILLPTLATGLLAFIGYVWGQGTGGSP